MTQRHDQHFQAVIMLLESINKAGDALIKAYDTYEPTPSIQQSDISEIHVEIDKEHIKRILNQNKKLIDQMKISTSMKQKILFLAADPQDETRLRLMQEFREIKHSIQKSTARDAIILCPPELSVRKKDFALRLLQERPRIVHFSGHGKSDGSLCFEGDDGLSQNVKPNDLELLFELHADYVDCVILNACYAAKQAAAISKHIDFVIGMSMAIGDQAAIDFSIGFYQAIGEGKGIYDAYKHGCALIASPEKAIPILLERSHT